VRERVRALLSVADQDTPIADVESDSLLDEASQAADVRVIRFVRADGRGAATVTTSLRPGAVDVDIEITPPAQTMVYARYADGSSQSADTDVDGRASLPSLRPGLMTFYVVGTGSADNLWRTAWLRY